MSAKATLEKGNHVYTVAGKQVPLCVSRILELSGIKQPYPEAAQRFVEHARDLGETVHEWADFLDSDAWKESDAIACLSETEPLPYVLAYQRFREEYRPSWDVIEGSYATDEFAGTVDRIGQIRQGINSPEVIIDIKTPRKAEAHWGIQLSAYQILTGRSECALYALLLSSDATYRLIPYQPEPEVFLAALKVAQWKCKHGKLR
jgi:hypothetical protein